MIDYVGASALSVAGVVGLDDQPPACLVLEWIDEGGTRTASGEDEFGRGLARLHQAGAATYGRSDHRPTGSLGLPNDPAATWPEFYADRRLRPLAAIAAERGSLYGSVIDDLLVVAERLDQFGAADEPPSRLHGDLWAGNRIVDRNGRSWLIDPAAHGGHREFDLAMMRLFGGFDDEAFTAYQDTSPLADGWETRIDLHQLAPLVVHAIKFGGGYRAAVEGALGRLLRPWAGR